MTREELRRLDAEVAEAIGWERWTCSDYDFREAVLFPPGTTLGATWRKVGREVPLEVNGAVMAPPWSSEWSVAGPLLEEFRLVVGQCFPGVPERGYVAQTCWRGDESWAQGYGDTGPEAIARAVLDLKGVKR